MRIKKIIILVFIILILIAVTILVIWIGNYLRQKNELNESLNEFSKIIETGNLDDLTLTIYSGAFVDTPRPSRIDDLLKRCNPIVVDGNTLKEHINLLNQLSNMNLVPDWRKTSCLDARIYYVFETKEHGKILYVAMWGHGNNYTNILVNGIEVKEKNIFYDIIIPFLREDKAKILEEFKQTE